MFNTIKIFTLVLAFALIGCKGGDGGTTGGTTPEIPGDDGILICTDQNAQNIGLNIPCACTSPYSVSNDGLSCVLTSSVHAGWFGYDDGLAPIDETDISTTPPLNNGLDDEDNHILITDKLLLGEVANNSMGVVIKDPTCSDLTSYTYVAVLISTLDDDEPSAITISLSGNTPTLNKIGVIMGAGTSGSTTERSITAPTGADCDAGLISFTGGEEIAHNGDYIIYTSTDGLYLGVRETAGVASGYYASRTFEGISTVSGSSRDYTISTDASLVATVQDAGMPDSDDGYIARVLGDSEGLLFSNEIGTSGATSRLSGVMVLFNGGVNALTVLPGLTDHNPDGNGVFYPTGADHFYFGTRQ